MRALHLIPLWLSAAVPALAQCEVTQLPPSTPGFNLGTGSAFDGDTVILSGKYLRVAVFDRTPTGWVQAASFKSAGQAILYFSDPALDGDRLTLVTGVRESNGLVGEAFVYSRNDNWTLPVTLRPSSTMVGLAFGSSLALHGDVLLVGASMNTMDYAMGPGEAYVFERIAGQWSETAVLGPHGFTGTQTDYGENVANDGTTLVVGSRFDDERVGFGGAVYVYEKVAGAWVESAKLFPAMPVHNARFGSSVAVDGAWIAVGSETLLVDGPKQTQRGQVVLFERTPAGWVERQVLIDPLGRRGDGFGYSVAIQGDLLAVGAPGVDALGANGQLVKNTGELFFFRRQGGVWSEESRHVATDVADAPWPGPEMGLHVALSGNQALWTGGWWRPDARVHSAGLDQVASVCSSTPNSTGFPAVLGASGCDSVEGNDLTLIARSVPDDCLGMLLFSDVPATLPFGNGLLCLGGALKRIPIGPAQGKVLATKVDFSQSPATLLVPGKSWYFQVVFRDVGFGTGFDSSDSVVVALQP